MAGHLSVEDQEKLRLAIEGYNESVPLWMLNRQRDLETGDELHLTGQQVKLTLKDDITRLRSIKCYRGVRHASGNKVRGQRGSFEWPWWLNTGCKQEEVRDLDGRAKIFET